MKDIVLFPMFAPNADQGGNPAANNRIDVDAACRVIGERVLALSKDQPELNPLDADNPRMVNFPELDNSPINFAGKTTIFDLGVAISNQLKADYEAAKAAKKPVQAQFPKISVQTDKEFIDLRIFSFNGVGTKTGNKDANGKDIYVASQKPEGYITAGITRRERVKFRSAGTVGYGKIVREDAATPNQEAQKTEVKQEAAKPAVA